MIQEGEGTSQIDIGDSDLEPRSLESSRAASLYSDQISRYHKSVRSLKVVLYGEPALKGPFERGLFSFREAAAEPKT